MSRGIGKRIIQVCRVIESHGPASHRVIHAALPEIMTGDAKGYCDRAVRLGLMTCAERVYAVVEGWKDNLGARPHKPKPRAPRQVQAKPIESGFKREPVPAYTGPVGLRVASVWQLGALA